jgi:hypothetical protein
MRGGEHARALDEWPFQSPAMMLCGACEVHVDGLRRGFTGINRRDECVVPCTDAPRRGFASPKMTEHRHQGHVDVRLA